MKTTWNWKTITGLVLHVVIAAIMVLAGSAKVLGLLPPDVVAKLGLTGWIAVIGAGELATAVLLVVPRTASLGVLLAGSFWGGAICLHLSRGEAFVLQSALLLLTWAGAYLRVPGVLASLSAPSKAVRPSADVAEALVA